MPVHPTAIVDASARVADTADIGPYCIVGPEVEIGEGTRLMAHVFTDGPMTIGDNNTIYPHVSLGAAPQDLKYKGEKSHVTIGHRNLIREFVTVHRGTEGGGMITTIGSDVLLQAYTHVAHDCHVGDHAILSHGATLGGHVTIGDWAIVGAWSGVHQFCRVGRHAMIGGYSVVTQDVMPYSTTVSPREIKTFGANRIGMERRGFSNESVEALQTMFRLLTRSNLNTSQAVAAIREELGGVAEVEEVLAFLETSQRGFIK
ncbi:MAG: acyl-ACP--UDP-N-acetylglucosamine O-acyltransferase [Bryobacteraceae bacterium]|nr:acyl-ACP--UDP-N-acetylglucosamine O-acyltransferase [Bryobacteraceae bacterium]